MKNEVAVSFCHGYVDEKYNPEGEERPALWHLKKNGEKAFYNYPFPRHPNDFKRYESLILGKMPFPDARDFKKKLPRFGFTGLEEEGEFIYAGSWNAIYKIRKTDFKLVNIITHNMMCDLHGIHVDKEYIINILTSKDTVVINDHEGNIVDHFSVKRDLSVVKEEEQEKIDWRFISKQFRGSTGYWHFNFVQRFGDEIWLTARNANCFVVVNRKTRKAHLRLMNLCTPALIHDGKRYKERYYHTSIDGKILISEEHEGSKLTTQEFVDNLQLYNRDLVTKLIRLEETELGREPNWCRGLDVKEEWMYVTIDGRYDTDLSFGLLELNEEGKVLSNERLKWSEIDNEKIIRFVTGFDVVVLD